MGTLKHNIHCNSSTKILNNHTFNKKIFKFETVN